MIGMIGDQEDVTVDEAKTKIEQSSVSVVLAVSDGEMKTYMVDNTADDQNPEDVLKQSMLGNLQGIADSVDDSDLNLMGGGSNE